VFAAIVTQLVTQWRRFVDVNRQFRLVSVGVAEVSVVWFLRLGMGQTSAYAQSPGAGSGTGLF
jgi:hypothetical protein